MPIDASIYGLQRQPSINTPFENLSAILALRNQQQAGEGIAEQRRASAEASRAMAAQREQETEIKRQEAARAAALRAEFSRVDPATGQPVAPEMNRIAGIIGPEAATNLFKGFEAVSKARLENRKLTREEIASGLGAVLSVPEPERPRFYAALRQSAIANGTIKPNEAPPNYDESFVKNALTAALSPEKIAELQRPVEVSPGASLMSPQTGGVIGTAPGGGTDDPASVKEYKFAVSQGFKGSITDYENAKQQAAQQRAPYFTYQALFDSTGRPTGQAMRFDARGGPPLVVDVAGISGGGQLKAPPGTTGTQAITNEASAAQLDRLKDMFNAGAARFIGPAEGRMRAIGQQIPGVPVNKVFSDFEAASSAFKNSVIKAITGAAMGEREADRIMKQIPDVTDKPEVWLSKYQQTKKNLADLANALAKKSGGVKSDPMGIR